jgi:hypothetical protein
MGGEAAVTLRLVRPEAPKPPRRKGERKPLLSPEEERRFRQAMRNLRDAFGTWGCLADAMGANEGTIDAMQQGRSRVSGDMLIRAMRASGLSLAELLGEPQIAGKCRACGGVRVHARAS